MYTCIHVLHLRIGFWNFEQINDTKLSMNQMCESTLKQLINYVDI